MERGARARNVVDVSRRTAIGSLGVAFSAAYLLSDVIEAAQGGFSTAQLWLTLVAEAAIVPLVLALYALQRPRLGRLGAVGAGAYAAIYAFFTFTVVYALVEGTADFDALSDALSPWMVIGGAVMVLAGLALGAAQLRARTLAPWTSVVFMAGVVLVALADGSPEALQVAAAGVRDVGFAAMCAAAAWPARVRA
jgi:hypothetical protein